MKLAPEADDSQLVRSRVEGHVAPLVSAEGFEWTTLAHFDAIIADTDDKIIVKKDLDSSDSGTLGGILHAKIYDVRYPEQDALETTGFIAMTRIENVVAHLNRERRFR